MDGRGDEAELIARMGLMMVSMVRRERRDG